MLLRCLRQRGSRLDSSLLCVGSNALACRSAGLFIRCVERSTDDFPIGRHLAPAIVDPGTGAGGVLDGQAGDFGGQRIKPGSVVGAGKLVERFALRNPQNVSPRHACDDTVEVGFVRRIGRLLQRIDRGPNPVEPMLYPIELARNPFAITFKAR